MAAPQHSGLDPDRPGWAEPDRSAMTRAERLLTTCAWCERVRVGERWLSADAAIRELRTFEWPEPPLFTHGMCEHCFDFLTAGRAAADATAPDEAA